MENTINVSIVMACYNRREQTIQTLNGFEKDYGKKYNFEVVIVDDDSKEEEKLNDIISDYSFPINLIEIDKNEKGDRVNPCIAYNKGFKQAKGEIIIIQNPECFHVGDVIGYTLNHLTEQDYFTYSCYTGNTKELTYELLNSEDIYNKIKTPDYDRRNRNALGLVWYNHPNEKGRDTKYHFCSAIYKYKLNLIGGFDQRFATGYCFDDDALLISIVHNLKLNVRIIHPDECFVLHQYHERNLSFNIISEADDHPIKKKWLHNKYLFENIKSEHEKYNFKYPKLLHLYWDGSPLSYLNYLTVLSFNDYNKEWKIIVYIPTKKSEKMSWASNEQKLKFTGECYFNKLREVNNISFQSIDFEKIGVYSDVSEVIKSDYFRYYILQKCGGLWSDFDIIYTGSIEEKMNFSEDVVIFRHDLTLGDQNIYLCTCYYPVGLFMCVPNSIFFQYLLNQCKFHYDSKSYQSLGAAMLYKLFPEPSDVYKVDKSVKICNKDYYLPWEWNQLGELYIRKENQLPENNIGIHWFNGAEISKTYAMHLDKRRKDFKILCYLDKFVDKYL